MENLGVVHVEKSEFDEFGDGPYAVPQVNPHQSRSTDVDDEDSKIKALVEGSALDWQHQIEEASRSARSRFVWRRPVMDGHGFGRVNILERKAPPPGYICHRCKVPGHLIQHCPTNGDPNYDIKKINRPTGIPSSMLIATQDGSYALPTGAVAAMKPDEAAFEKEIEGIPSTTTTTTRSLADIPPDLRCPLCKQVMKDAVLTSKCCFRSFCDKCIRNQFISKQMCVCGATNVLADDLLPNMTLRATIKRLTMESYNSRAEVSGAQGMVESTARPAAGCKVPSPPSSLFAASSKREEKKSSTSDNGTLLAVGTAEEAEQISNSSPQQPDQSLEKATYMQDNVALVADDKVQSNTTEPAMKKTKRKRVSLPTPGNIQWTGGPEDVAALNYMMPCAPSPCYPYWRGMQPGMDGFMIPYAGMIPYMGYVPHPFDFPLGSILPQGPFAQMPLPPQTRDCSENAMSSKPHNTINNEEGKSDAQGTDLRPRRKPEMDAPENLDLRREVSTITDEVSLMESKHNSRPIPQPASSESCHNNQEKRTTSLDRSHRHHQNERQTISNNSGNYHYHSHHPSERDTSLKTSPRDRSRHLHYHSHQRSERETCSRSDRSCSHYYHSHHKPERETRLENSPREVKETLQPRKKREYDPPLHEVEHIHIAKKRSEQGDATAKIREAPENFEAEKLHKPSVFSRISRTNDGGSKKKNILGERSLDHKNGYQGHLSSSSHYHHHQSSNGRCEENIAAAVTMMRTDDDERHFKRRRSWYDSESSRTHRATSRSRDRMPLPSLNQSLSQVYCF